MKKMLLSLAYLCLGVVSVYAQDRTCGSHDWHHQQLATNPEYVANRATIEAQIERYQTRPVKQRGVKIIPVVVHVVYNSAAQNISEAQILSQIDVLNKDFRRLNTDAGNTPAAFAPLAADCEVQFCLAQVDPNGNPTTGIIRKFTTNIGFVGNDAVKFAETGGDPAWDRNKYLNIWVCNLTDGLGYATFPGAPAQLDGVVIRHSAFGLGGSTLFPYNLGRTATHEVGHWMNLFHIWGDDGTGCNGSDLVDDTPNQAGYNVSCPVFPRVSCNNGPNGDMFMNYMDYTNDACMNMFTQGQKLRIDATFAFGGPRFAILSSNACNNNACAVADSLYATNVTWNSAQVGWAAVPSATNYIFQYKLTSDTGWSTVNTASTTYAFSGLNALTAYDFRVMTQCENGYSSFSNPFTFTTTSEPIPCNAPDSLFASVISSSTAILGWRNLANANEYIVRYKATTNMNWIIDTVSTNRDTVAELVPTTSYEFQVQTICSNGLSIWSALTNFTTPAAPIICSNSFEPNNSLNAATPTAINTTVASMIASSNDKDYFVFTTTASQPKIRITLSNLPTNYNLSLISANGQTLATSSRSGTQSEEIKYNSASNGGTYYAYVFGSSKNSFNSSVCYNLNISTSANNFRIDTPYPGNENDDDDDRQDITVSENMVLHYTALANEEVSISVFSTTGQQLFQSTVIAPLDGVNTLHLNQKTFSPGLYLVQVLHGHEKQTTKFIVR